MIKAFEGLGRVEIASRTTRREIIDSKHPIASNQNGGIVLNETHLGRDPDSASFISDDVAFSDVDVAETDLIDLGITRQFATTSAHAFIGEYFPTAASGFGKRAFFRCYVSGTNAASKTIRGYIKSVGGADNTVLDLEVEEVISPTLVIYSGFKSLSVSTNHRDIERWSIGGISVPGMQISGLQFALGDGPFWINHIDYPLKDQTPLGYNVAASSIKDMRRLVLAGGSQVAG